MYSDKNWLFFFSTGASNDAPAFYFLFVSGLINIDKIVAKNIILKLCV